MSLGAYVRAKRYELELSAAELAERTGLSKPYIYNIEQDRAESLSDDAIERLEHVLRTPKGALFRLAYRTPLDVRQILNLDPDMSDCIRILKRADLDGRALRTILEKEAAATTPALDGTLSKLLKALRSVHSDDLPEAVRPFFAAWKDEVREREGVL